MKNLEFPIVGTKMKGLNKKFDLESPAGRKEYFEAKVGDEITQIKKYLDTNTFLAYFLGKKSSGKGTYSKLIAEIFGSDKVAHVSVGDLVRETDDWKAFEKTEAFGRLQKYYRGYVSFETIVKSLESRSTQKLLPTEFILALVKAKIDELQGKAIFIDGLPRSMDQVSYSLYFREVVGFRDDPDFFVLIDIPESVIEERMKYRVVCPTCNTSRNIKLLVTSKIEYDKKEGKFHLLCDNPDCRDSGRVRMQPKEGDDKGLEPIRERLDKDEELMKQAFALYGIPKILLRNHVPVNEALDNFDAYEITPEYVLIEKDGKVEVEEKPWTVKDDNGVECNSLLAPPVVATFIKQLAEVLKT
jgi:adenylate kinase family enzyme